MPGVLLLLGPAVHLLALKALHAVIIDDRIPIWNILNPVDVSSCDVMTYRDEKEALIAQVSVLERELKDYRDVRPCPACGSPNPKDARFCGSCAARLEPAEHPIIKRRHLALVAVLSIVTLSIYNVYLVYAWACDLNRLAGRARRNPTTVLIVSIITLGLAALIYECLYAREVEELVRQFGKRPFQRRLLSVVIAINVSALMLSVIPFGVIVGLPLGVVATVLIQRELNAFGGES
jgi:hypothetical protein